MNKRNRNICSRPDLIALTVLSVCFLIGLLLGCLLASFFQKGSNTYLSHYLDGFLSVLGAGEGAHASLFSTFWEICRWPLFAALMGTTLFGVIALPLLLCIRSFLLSYAVSVFICLYGTWHGLLLALGIFGIPALCSVLSLFVIGRSVLHYRYEAHRKGGTGRAVWQKIPLSDLLTVPALLAAGVIVQHWICPALLGRLISALML